MDTAADKRIHVIDMARFYAMSLVFYGHFIEEFKLLGNPAGISQYKFIYSFHMVLFIVLAGYVAKDPHKFKGLSSFLKHRFFSRFLPFLFFTVFMMALPLFFTEKYMGQNFSPSIGIYVHGLISSLFGLPVFCVPSWFLLLIIGVEVVHYAGFRFVRDSNTKILIGAALFYTIGYLLNLKLDVFNPLKGRTIGWNYFFIHEAITLYGFYLIGIYLRRKRVFMDQMPVFLLISGGFLCFLFVWFTYKLNTGPFNFHPYNDVVIIFASHGNMLLFPLTAVAGCGLVLFLAKITPASPTMSWMGQNTLILMCLNGIFYHYINRPAAKWILDHLSGSTLMVSAVGIGMTTASLVLCIPLIFLLNKYIPQLVGKPGVSGPILKSLVQEKP